MKLMCYKAGERHDRLAVLETPTDPTLTLTLTLDSLEFHCI